MGRLKTVRKLPGATTPVKTSAADWAKAVPCLLILIAGFAVIVLLLYSVMTSSVK